MTEGATAPPIIPTLAAIRSALADVADPEIPAISIVDLGIVHRVEIAPDVTDRLSSFGAPVEVAISFEVPWTSERISRVGRQRLRESGFAPPAEPDDVRCPYCDSANVTMDSAFGPTLCRSLFYCRTCRQPFESFKAV